MAVRAFIVDRLDSCDCSLAQLELCDSKKVRCLSRKFGDCLRGKFDPYIGARDHPKSIYTVIVCEFFKAKGVS